VQHSDMQAGNEFHNPHINNANRKRTF